MHLPWRTPEFGPPIHTSVTTAEARELRRLAMDRNVLEVGAAYGYSTILMAQVAESVTSIDPHTGLNSLPVFSENLTKYEIGNVDVRVGFSQAIFPELFRGHYGMVFIDGDHSYEQVCFERDWARRLVKPFGAVIAFHDYDEVSCPGVRQALDEWCAPSYIVDTLAVYSDPRL